MTVIIVHTVAQLAREVGIIDETQYRNFCIYEEYEKMKQNNNKNIVFDLSDKHNLSSDAIYKILKEQKELRK